MDALTGHQIFSYIRLGFRDRERPRARVRIDFGRGAAISEYGAEVGVAFAMDQANLANRANNVWNRLLVPIGIEIRSLGI